MSLYRCAACGSPNVVTDTQTGGISYNYVKGAIGTVVLGAGGAAAGIGSNQEKVYKCPDCGITLTYAMPNEIKQLVDFGIITPSIRNNLMLCGQKIEWSALVSQYKYIAVELGKEPATTAAPTSMKLESNENVSKQEFDEAVEFVMPIFDKIDQQKHHTRRGNYTRIEDSYIGFKEAPITTEEYLELKKNLKLIGENIFRFTSPGHKYKGLDDYQIGGIITAYLIDYFEENNFTPYSFLRLQYDHKLHGKALFFTDDNFDYWEKFLVNAMWGCGKRDYWIWFGSEPNRNFDEEISLLHLSGIKAEEAEEWYKRRSHAIKFTEYLFLSSKTMDFVHPLFKMIDGKLHYLDNKSAVREANINGNTNVMAYYFEHYPEKKQGFEEGKAQIISEHKQTICQIKELESEWDKIMEDNNSIYSSKKALEEEILGLEKELKKQKNKIFGKKQAEIRIAELSPKLELKQHELSQVKQAIENQADRIKAIPKEQKCLKEKLKLYEEYFQKYDELFQEYDYFRVWKPVE